MIKAISTLLMLAAPLAAQAAETRELVRFIACPTYRNADSGRKSGCWLADDPVTGKRWDVSQSPYKPDWNFAILVEGRVAAAATDVCGGAALDPVRTSRLMDRPCTRHMLPAESYPGRRYKLHGRYIDPVSVARPVPPGPYAERTFPVYFEFGNDFLIYQYDDYLLDKAATWIKAAKPRKVVVTGHAATAPEMVSGERLAERPVVARERAEMVAETLVRLMPDLKVEARWQTDSQPIEEPEADGIPGQSQRRVDIRAVF